MVLLHKIQQITVKFIYNNKSFLISIVYTRCSALEILELWDKFQSVGISWDIPLIIGGDFNIILNKEEKMGGLAFEQQEAMDFAFFISSCSLSEVKFSGSNFTWWNGRIEDEYIFKRLDRVLVNNPLLDIFFHLSYITSSGKDLIMPLFIWFVILKRESQLSLFVS